MKGMNPGGKIRRWYAKYRRDLPWRRTRDPYKIWISEIILQQTRIDQGTAYYHRFIGTFPDVGSLASAPLDEVLNVWQGLGYYSRARNLHLSARYIVETLDGKIPDTFEGLLELKGIGTYTAAAIASICYGEPEAVVDGNVTRVIARFYGVEDVVDSAKGKGTIHRLAADLLDRETPGDHNQAMMEFGAMQCVPGIPDCRACPLAGSCAAYATGKVGHLPVKRPKKAPVKRWIYFFIVTYDRKASRKNGEDLVLLSRNGQTGIWRSLYMFPAMESGTPVPEDRLRKEEPEKLFPGCGPFEVLNISDYMKHQLSHRTLYSRFIHLRPFRKPGVLPPGWLEVPTGRLTDYPVPRLINRYLEVAKI